MKKDSFEKKLAGYITLATAYLAAHPVDANAQILYNDINPDAILQNDTFNLDLNNDGIVDFMMSHFGQFDFYNNVYVCRDEINGYPLNGVVVSPSCPFSGAVPIPFGSVINQADQFLGFPFMNSQYNNSLFPIWSEGCMVGDNKYMGLKVIKNGTAYYGWMRLSIDSANHMISTLKDYAINLTPNTQIQAGVYYGTCPKPVNLNSVSINNHSQKLQWTIQGTSIGYKVRVRKTGTIAWTSFAVSSNIGFKQIYGLTPNTNYEWQVRSICQQTPLVQSNFTTLQTFTTPLRLEDESENDVLNETQNELFIYPNPATNELFLLTDEAGDYEMKIINMLGQIVVSEKINLLKEQSIIVNISNLPSGTYQAIVTGNNGNQIGRFVKE